MIDNRLIEADATKLDELRKIIKEQENAEKLRCARTYRAETRFL